MEPLVAFGIVMLCVCALGLLAICITVALDLWREESIPEVDLSDSVVWPMSAEAYSRHYGVARFKRRG